MVKLIIKKLFFLVFSRLKQDLFIFNSRKVLRKGKKYLQDGFFMFGFIMKNTKENQI